MKHGSFWVRGGRALLFWLSGFFLFFFLFLWCFFFLDRRQAARTYDQAAARFAPSASPGPEEEGLQIDFAALQKVNRDIWGWLEFPALEISYPLLQGEDNAYYLDHLYDGSAGSGGALFLDAAGDPLLGDALTLLYGHNMTDGSMFGALTRYLDSSFYDPDQRVFLYLPGEDSPRQYQVVLFAQVAADAPFYFTRYQLDSAPYAALLDWAEDRQLYPTGLSLSPHRPTLVLSTCTWDGRQRLVAFCQEPESCF